MTKGRAAVSVTWPDVQHRPEWTVPLPMTYMQAALTILAHAEHPLTVPEITAVAVAEGLVRPRGRTPDRTMSSVLYRRMAADPDAPVISRGGRLWLRGKPLPADDASYLTTRARRAHSNARRESSDAPRGSAARRVTILPPPPLHLPDDVVTIDDRDTGHRRADYAPTRRERAVTRAGERGSRALARLAARRAARPELGAWDVTLTATQLVAPLLAHLGYRKGGELSGGERTGRGTLSYMLSAGGMPAIALDVRRLGHDLNDDDAWHALGRARTAGAPYAATSNGQELRLYATAIADAQDNLASAHMILLNLQIIPGDSAGRSEQTVALWLLSRDAVDAGALDAYVANRVVTSTLLNALEVPGSALARALVADVRTRSGMTLPAHLILRHARLAVHEQRGRDGEPLPEDVATVAAVRGPRLEYSAATIEDEAATASSGERYKYVG